MGKRRKARESALQILFQLEFNDSHLEDTIKEFWKGRKASDEIKSYSTWLVDGIFSKQKKIDNLIQSVSKNWRISRMAIVDRNLLRMAVYEFFFEEDLAPAIVINEAIEIAKKYSSEEAATFINGVLDNIHKNMDKIKETFKEE